MLLRTASIAERDIIDASLWLDQQQFGSGADFQAAMHETAASITQAPLACPTLIFAGTHFRKTLRWRFVGRFPYLAVFSVNGDEILIVAVLHKQRDVESILRARVGIIE
jgi:plasmid stabilization system protein ParE